MTEKNEAVQFIKVNQDYVLKFLDQARQRIVMAKAGYFVSEVKKLIDLKENKSVRCDVYVDSDEKTVRYGFGEQKALELLKENIENLNIQSANFIRMAIIIVDEQVLVYSPVALSWEEPPETVEFPNGFIGGKLMAESLLKQIDGEPVHIEIDGGKLEIPICPIPIKSNKEISDELNKTITSLKDNPPTDPARLRKTTFYRNTYKLLKMILHGVKIKDKSISLKPFNVMFPGTAPRLKSSWKALTSEDVVKLKFINDFHAKANKILEKHTFDAKRFGTLIEVRKIKQFEDCMTCEISVLIEQLVGGSGCENQKLQNSDGTTLVSLLEKSRTDLIDHLFPLAVKEESCWAKLFENERSLFRELQNKAISKEDAVKKAVETFVDDSLDFPKADEMIDLIHADFDYYDISDELLGKEEFIEIIKEYDLKVREYEQGYKKDEPKQVKLF
jgi:hypothetical protein